MIIYKATSTTTGKSYIGQTRHNLDKRIYGHTKSSVRYNTHFYNAIRKYGIDDFQWEILCECDTKEELDEMEYHYIMQYDTYHNGYNSTWGGDGTQLFGKDNGWYGKRLTDEKLKQMSENRKGKGTGDRNSMKRPEVVEKMLLSRKGVKRPDFAKMARERMCGKTYEEVYGEKKATEIKKKQSKSNIGKHNIPRTKETKDKMREVRSIYQYELISPDGTVYTTNSIRQFSQIHNLNKSCLLKLVKGKIKKGNHKGWTGRIVKKLE
jgi:group I intron endonuclease